MTELDLSTKEIMEQFKRRVTNRRLYFYEWAEYYEILRNNISLGLDSEVKSQVIELLLREDYVAFTCEEEKGTFKSLGNALFSSAKLSRIAKN